MRNLLALWTGILLAAPAAGVDFAVEIPAVEMPALEIHELELPRVRREAPRPGVAMIVCIDFCARATDELPPAHPVVFPGPPEPFVPQPWLSDGLDVLFWVHIDRLR